jgi:hypothetical protein
VECDIRGYAVFKTRGYATQEFSGDHVRRKSKLRYDTWGVVLKRGLRNRYNDIKYDKTK